MANRLFPGERVLHFFFFFLAAKITAEVTAAMKLKDAHSLEETMTNLDRILKSRDITLPTKVHLVKVVFFSSYV